MNTALETAKQWGATFDNAPLWIQFGIGLIAFGYLLRVIPKFPNAWIPPVLIFIGGLVAIWAVPMQDSGQWDFRVRNPERADEIRRVAFGLTIGVVAAGIVKYAMAPAERWLVKKWKARFGNNDTALIQKPPEPGK